MLNLTLAVLLAAPAVQAPAAPGEPEKLAALARLYGVVRWFHPTDAAQEVEWNRFAVHAAAAVRSARTADDLQRVLREQFAPVASGIVVGTELPPPTAPLPAAAGQGLVAWRHVGLGFGGESGGAYSSARTRRRAPSTIDGFASLIQSLPAGELRGKLVRLTARVKAESAGPDGAAALWLRVDRGEEPGFFDNMSDRPIQAPEWKEYTIEGRVDADALHMAFGVLARGPVRAGFDDVRLAVQEADGTWRPLPVLNPGFEKHEGWRRVGTSRRSELSYPTEAPPEGLRFAALTPPNTDAQPLFEAPLQAGGHVDLDLGLGLRARVPIVLTDAEAAGTPEQRALLDALQGKLALLPEAGSPLKADVRAADVVVAWSAFRHFYPYWAELDVDWDARLPALLESAAAAQTAEAHRDAMLRLVAEIRDGHGRVTDANPGRLAWLPIAARRLEGRLVVTASAVPDRVRVGDVIASVDGRPAAAWFAEREALHSGSPQWRAARAATDLAFGREGSRVTLALEREGAPAAQVELVRERREPAREERPAPLAALRPGVWYVDLERASWVSVQARLGELAEAKAVIFDLRGYPSDAGSRILRHLLAEPEQSRWMHLPRIAEPFGKIAGWQALGWDLSPASPRIAGKLAFLTDARAISYAESVMGYVEGLRLGAIVGAPTAGTNGNVNGFSLPSGMKLGFTGMRVTRHDGSAFHLAGVRPTVPIEPTLAGVRAGKDEVLERALAVVGAEEKPAEATAPPAPRAP
jgi:hypothetical protein